MRSALVALAVVGSALGLAVPVRAVGLPDRLASLTISIWPEYDRPGALYIYRGELPEGTPLPARITFRLPRQPSSTAGVDGAGRFRYLRPTVVEEGSTFVVSYDVSWPPFQFEYYDDVLLQQGAARELVFDYRADYAIDYLALEVKEPFGASGFATEPRADAQSQADDGLTVHHRTVGPVAAGEEVHWKVTYTKDDPRLAAEALGLPTPAPSSYEAAPGETAPGPSRGWLVAGLVALAALLLGGGAGLAVRRGTGRPATAEDLLGGRSQAGRRSSVRAGAAARTGPRPSQYCHQCGTHMNKGDVFCRRCGTRRRGA